MLGDGHCDEECDTSECNGDGHDCECAPGCRFKDLATCKDECMVPACGFSRMPGYASCSEFRSTVETYNAIITYDPFNYRNAPLFDDAWCWVCPLEQSFTQCLEDTLCNSQDCLYNFGLCESSPECEAGGTDEDSWTCFKCKEGQVNDLGTCKETCSPGLGLYPWLGNQCFPVEDGSTPEHPDVIFVDDADFGQRLSFPSLSEALANARKRHTLVLLSGQHFFSVQQASRFVLSAYHDSRRSLTFEDATANITLVPACSNCRATVHLDYSDLPRLFFDRAHRKYCETSPYGLLRIEKVDFVMDRSAESAAVSLLELSSWKVHLEHVSFRGITGYDSIINIFITGYLTMVDVTFQNISVSENVVNKVMGGDCLEESLLFGELIYINGTVSAVQAQAVFDIRKTSRAIVSGVMVQFVEATNFLSATLAAQVILSDCRFLYNQFRRGAALYASPISFDYTVIYQFVKYFDLAGPNFLVTKSEFRGNEAQQSLSFDFGFVMRSVRVTDCDFHDEWHTILLVAKSTPVLKSDIYGVGRYADGVRRNTEPIFVDLRNLRLQNCTAPFSLLSVANFPHVTLSDIDIIGSPKKSTTAIIFSNCFNVSVNRVFISDFHCESGFSVLNSSSITGILSFASTLIAQSSGEELLSIFAADSVDFNNFTVVHSIATRLISLKEVGSSAMQFSLFESNEASDNLFFCNTTLCQISESQFLLNYVGSGSVVQMPTSKSQLTSLKIKNSLFVQNRAGNSGAIVFIQATIKSQPSQLILQHLNFTSNIAATAVVLTSTRTVLTEDSELQDCRFQQNIADGSVLGLRYEQGTLTISQSYFREDERDAISFAPSSGNTVPHLFISHTEFVGVKGTAVYIHQTLSGSIFSNCLSASVVLQQVQGTIAHCIFKNNTAYSGGALMLEQGSVAHFYNCTFSHNSAASTGGALAVADGSRLICDHCTFTGNSAATTGGAMYISPDAAVELFRCQLEDNSAVDGSAMCLLMSAPSVAAYCDFSHNRANDQATIAVFFSSLALRNCTVHENFCGQKTPGVILSHSNLTVEACVFASLRGLTGTILHATMRSIVTISKSEFRDSESQGGAIYVDDTVVNISNSVFQSMSADYGSAIASVGDSQVLFSNNTVQRQSNNSGGALHIMQSACSVSNSRFSALNSSAVYSKRASIALDKSTFHSDFHLDITAAEGGGLYCQDCESVKIAKCSFSMSKAASGAGIFLLRSTDVFSIKNCTFQDNVAEESAGIHADMATLEVEHCDFVNNRAESRGGAVTLLCTDTCRQSLQRNRFVMNKAESHGGAICWHGNTPKFVANKFEANSAPYGPDVSSFSTSLHLMNTSLPAIASGQVFPSVLVVEMRDHFNQTVLTDNSTTAQLSILSGEVYGKAKATASMGRLIFSGFSLVGQSNTTIHISSVELKSALAIDISFRNCVMGEFQTKGRCIICGPGTYSVDPAKSCAECDKHADCPGTYYLTPRPGYWRPSIHSTRLYQCPNPGACLGPPALTGTCASGYTGNMCQTCAVDYVRYLKTHCQPCPSQTSAALGTVGLMVGAVLFSGILVITSIKSAYKEKSQLSLSLKILMNYLQLVMLMGNFNLSWPTLTKKLLNMQDSAGGFSEQIFAPGCLRSSYDENEDFYWKVVAMAFVPLGALSLSSAMWALWALVRNQSSIVRNELVGSGTILFFLVHPNVIRVMFSALNCEEIDGEYWVVGLKQRCWQGTHWKFAIATALPSLLLWGVGVPALVLLLMSRQRNKLSELQVRVQFGFLFNGYSPEKYYWELIVVYRKLVIISLAVFLSFAPQVVPALSALAVLILSFVLQEIHKPFRHATFNALEKQSLLVSFVTLFCGLYYLFGGLSTASETLFFAAIVGVNVYFLQYWVRATFKDWAAKVLKLLPCSQRFFVVLGEDRVVTLKQYRAIRDLAQRTRVPLQALQKQVYFSKLSKQLV